MTATPKRQDNIDTFRYFGPPLYTYSLRKGIDDGFLAPYRVHRVITEWDAAGWRPSQGDLDRYGREIPDEVYETPDFERIIALKARRAAERPAGIDFAALRRQVTIEQVLRHLGHLDRLRGWGAQRRGPCPVHGSSHVGSRSFSVNLQKNVFRCFSAECGVKGNVLDLWAAVHGLPLGQAAKHLAQTFGLDPANGIREEEPVLPHVAHVAPCTAAATTQ